MFDEFREGEFERRTIPVGRNRGGSRKMSPTEREGRMTERFPLPFITEKTQVERKWFEPIAKNSSPVPYLPRICLAQVV